MNFEQRYYHRQTSVLGQKTQQKLRSMKVFICNLTKNGLEVSKNLAMMGVKVLSLYDRNKVEEKDALNSFYFAKDDIGKRTKAQACISKLQRVALNTKMVVAETNDERYIVQNFDVVVLADSWDYNSVVSLNNRMRQLRKGFILINSLALYGFIFVDFGQGHEIMDASGQKPIQKQISHISNKKQAQVTVSNWDLKKIEVGEEVFISNVKGMEGINGKSYKIIDRNQSTYRINADTSNLPQYRSGGTIEQAKGQFVDHHVQVYLGLQGARKVQQILRYQSFEQNMKTQTKDEKQNPGVIQSRKHLNLKQIIIISSIFGFYSKHQRLPNLLNHEQAKQIIDNINIPQLSDEYKRQVSMRELRKILLYGRLQYSFFSTMLGGIAAQQVIKYTNKYTPINQWMHFNEMQLLCDQQSEYSNQYEYILGKENASKLEKLNLMIVGAGALGSQFTKMLAQMNLAKDSGKLTIVDNDNLNDYNLNRMCLVTKEDIDQNKAYLLASKAKDINPNMNIAAFNERVNNFGPNINKKTTLPWKDQDIIISAVDSFGSRQNINKNCIKHSKIMLDCGSEYLKLSTEVIIPHRTMSYVDFSNYEELVNFGKRNGFPRKIQEVIFKMKDKLESVLQISSDLVQMTKDPIRFVQDYKKDPSRYRDFQQQYSRLGQILKFYKISQSKSVQRCIEAALISFHALFTENPRKLLQLWPQDHINEEDGSYFWSGFKTAPKIINFDVQDPIHVQFVYSLSTIYAKMLQIKPLIEEDSIKVMKTIINHEQFAEMCMTQNRKVDKIEQAIKKINQGIIGQLTNCKFNYHQIYEFVSSNPCPSHLSFLYSSSIIYAHIYQLRQTSRLQIQNRVCRSVPTIITTLAISAALVTLELLKIVKSDYSLCRNTYANFAISKIVQSQLSQPKLNFDSQYDVLLCGAVKMIPEYLDSWDVMHIVGPMTVQQLKNHYQNRLKITIHAVYANSYQQLVYGFNAGVNRQIQNMQVSQALRWVLKNKKKEPNIQLPIQLNIYADYQEQQSDAVLPILNYHLPV